MKSETRNEPAPDQKHSEYDPPQVERVMDADELAREVHYAGGVNPVST